MKFFNWTTRSGATMLCAVSVLSFAPAAIAAPAGQPVAATDQPETTETSPPAGGESDPVLTPDSTPVTQAERTPAKRTGPVKVRISPRTARYGSKVTVRGRSGLARRTRVRLFFQRSGGSRWQRLKTVRADRKGRYRTRIRAAKNGRIRVEVVGNRDSAVKSLAVRSRLKVGPVRRLVNLGDKVRIGGTVLPRGARKVTVRVSGAGQRILRTRANARGKFRLKWSPRQSGNFRISVSAASNRVARGDRSRRIRLVELRPTHASFYGPGLYGGALACGGSLSPSTRGVAHKTLPCGSKVTLRYGNRTVTTRVVDRGPYVAGREFDLTAATRNDLGFGDIGTVWTNR